MVSLGWSLVSVIGLEGSWSWMESVICCDSVPSENWRVNGSVVGSKGACITVAEVRVFVVGWIANTWSSLLNGSGRCRILSRSALDVKVKEPSYCS